MGCGRAQGPWRTERPSWNSPGSLTLCSGLGPLLGTTSLIPPSWVTQPESPTRVLRAGPTTQGKSVCWASCRSLSLPWVCRSRLRAPDQLSALRCPSAFWQLGALSPFLLTPVGCVVWEREASCHEALICTCPQLQESRLVALSRSPKLPEGQTGTGLPPLRPRAAHGRPELGSCPRSLLLTSCFLDPEETGDDGEMWPGVPLVQDSCLGEPSGVVWVLRPLPSPPSSGE